MSLSMRTLVNPRTHTHEVRYIFMDSAVTYFNLTFRSPQNVVQKFPSMDSF